MFHKTCYKNRQSQKKQISVSCRGGNFKTKNIVYAATCKLCNKNNTYIGKSITSLSQRVNGHREQYRKLIGDNIDVINIDAFDGDNFLGAHIIRKHKIKKIRKISLLFLIIYG